jgi:hypothetical protein
MKEFEKKTPSREPSSEGMKGLSKFLRMSDSKYRRRLTGDTRSGQDLQATHSPGAERAACARSSKTLRKEFMVLENKLREANSNPCRPSIRTKLVNALYEAREQITSLKEEVTSSAPRRPPTASTSRSRGCDHQRPVPGTQGKSTCTPRSRRRPSSPVRAGERGLNVVEVAGYEIQGDVSSSGCSRRGGLSSPSAPTRSGSWPTPPSSSRSATHPVDGKSGYLREAAQSEGRPALEKS